ncbi:transposase, Ptta/En/Spm [Tanacetum coccineum]
MVRQSSIMDNASFPSLHEHMPSSSGGEFGVEQVAVASTKIIGNVGCVSTGFIDSIPMQNTTTPICKPSKFADGMSKGTAYEDVTMTKNPVNQADIIDQVDNTPDNVVSPSYRTKLRPTSFTMANLRKLKANVPNDADYEIASPYLVDEFFWSLGIIARNASYAPLTYNSWPKVPNKEMMWKYVLGKYIVPDNAKSWELTTIRDCWRKKIRNYNPPKHESAPTHPFLAVMNKDASTFPWEIVKSPTVSLEVKKGQSADMVRDLEANYERRMSGLKEDHARKLDAMQQKNDDVREKLIEDVMRKILGKLLIEVGTAIWTADQDMNYQQYHHVINTVHISYFNVASPNLSPNGSATKNGSEQVDNTLVNVVPPSYATKLRPTSSIMANIQKLKANVPNDADYDVSYAPLNYKSWPKVPDKEMMWKYVWKYCLAGRDLRLSQKNMHTVGPKSFAMIREEMKNEYPNKEEPSLTKILECTRQRKEGNVYVDTYDDTENKIYDGHCRLFGKGVTNTLIKNVNGDGSASTVPREIVKSHKVSLEVEKGRSADILRDLKANCERRMSELKEDHAGN